jgi:hypothetical protein
VIKCGPIPTGFGEQFLAFQPTLASAIFRLDELYRRIRREEKATIADKAQIESERFATQMREFDGFRVALKSALEVGRSIGDAFAWFFYRKSQHRIAQHLQHPVIPHTPPGIGGQAELAFLNHLRYAGCIVIYHGITSFLRIGDVSFLDIRSGEVIGLGELKARKVTPGEAAVTLYMMGTDRKRIPFSKVPIAPAPPQLQLPESRKDFAERLERQIAEMRGALELCQDNPPPGVPEAFSKPNDLYDGYHAGSLKTLGDSLDTKEVAYEQVGSGLLLVGLNVMPEASLSDRLFGATEVDFIAARESRRACGQARSLQVAR